MKYTANEKALYYDNKLICEFGYLIASILENKGNCFVLLEPKENENVYYINNKGDLMWKVSPDEGIHEIIKMNTNSLFEGKKYYESKCPYMEMEIIDENLRLYNWCGYSVKVDIRNGEILTVDFVK